MKCLYICIATLLACAPPNTVAAIDVPAAYSAKIRVFGAHAVVQDLTKNDRSNPHEWADLMRAIAGGDRDYMKVALELKPGASGRSADDLLSASRLVLRKAPADTLRLFWTTFGTDMCSMSGGNDPDNDLKRFNELNKSISQISAPDLVGYRNECLKELESWRSDLSRSASATYLSPRFQDIALYIGAQRVDTTTFREKKFVLGSGDYVMVLPTRASLGTRVVVPLGGGTDFTYWSASPGFQVGDTDLVSVSRFARPDAWPVRDVEVVDGNGCNCMIETDSKGDGTAGIVCDIEGTTTWPVMVLVYRDYFLVVPTHSLASPNPNEPIWAGRLNATRSSIERFLGAPSADRRRFKQQHLHSDLPPVAQ